jgi:hypothetical protein
VTAARALVLLALVACKKEPAVEETGPRGTEPVAPDAAHIDDLPVAVYGVPNVDDDNEDGDVDWDERGAGGENDRSELIVPASLLSELGPDDVLELTLGGDANGVRVWYDGSVAMDSGDPSTTLSDNEADVVFEVEFKDFLVEASIQWTWRDADGAEVASTSTRLLAAPLILNHHLQPSEHTWMMDTSAFGGNAQMVDEYSDALGADFSPIDDNRYQYDVWIQDEIEFASVTAPGHRVDVVIDSIRDRGLDNFPEAEIEAPDFAVMTWGAGFATSQDSFGNMEVTPPFTAPDGTEYPYGRIYYGEAGSYVPTRSLTDFLEEQKIQDPLVLDTSWLCVGHVDEYTSFVPDPTAPRGFRLLVGDVPMAYAMMEAMDPSTSLPLYNSGHNYGSIGEIVDDGPLRALNDDLQSDYIDPAVDLFREELGVTEDEIIRFPAIFEEVGYCGRFVAALVPGTPNLIVGNRTPGESKVFWADPHFRTNDADLGSDLFIPEMEALMPSDMEFHWMDDWDVYHLALGEVHCGTNVTRTPTADWWERGLHLLDR